MKKTATKPSASPERKAAVKPAAAARKAPAKATKRSLVSAAIEKVKAALRPSASTASTKAKATLTTAKPAVSPAPAERPKSAPRSIPAKPEAPPVIEAAALAPKTKRPVAAKKSAPKKSAPVEIPPILLEGDESALPKISGPGRRFALGSIAPAEKFPADLGELPEAYGTGRLTLTARDPHWLYAHWDLTAEQLRTHNRASASGHLAVRVYENAVAGKPVTEVQVHPESRTWFIHVGKGGAKFIAELGYLAKQGGKWNVVSTSRATVTPPDSLSDDTSIRFATLPIELSFTQLLALLKTAVRDHVPLIEAIEQLRALGYTGLPDVAALHSTRWTPAQEAAMAEVLSMDSVRRVWMGSLEITELLRRQLLRDLSSQAAARPALPSSLGVSSLGVSSLSSPFGGVPRKKGFWFNVNAELIIYGATEPDATVTIGGRNIRLRPDGTFSYRFILPDGDFDLPAIATSADGDDTRSAALTFRRATEYRGHVGAHPQDPQMKPPRAEHVS